MQPTPNIVSWKVPIVRFRFWRLRGDWCAMDWAPAPHLLDRVIVDGADDGTVPLHYRPDGPSPAC